MSDSVEDKIYDSFCMVRNEVILAIPNTYDLAVYMHLKRYANNTTKKCWPSLNRLKEECKVGKDRLIKSLKSLEDNGFIKVEKSQNKNNIYTLLDYNNPSRSNRLVGEEDSTSRSDRPELVGETDTNYTYLTKRTKDTKRDIDRIKNDSDFQKTWLKEKLNPLQEKYTKDELNEFYKYWTTACDVSGESNLTKELTKPKQAQKGFSVAQRVAYAKRVGMLNKRTDSKGAPQQQKTFYELERQQKVDNLNHALNYNPFAEDLKDV